jgi:beta-barrel assembly-enhancing protease
VLTSELQFYVMKSNEVNAFATNQGIIFVTIGLLSQLENEGQLAAVLSHEIAHYEREHSINKILENEKIETQNTSGRYNRKDSRMRLLSAFSRDMEFEADSLGFIRLVERGYDKQVAISVLDVLQFKMLPIDDLDFDYNYLTLGMTTIPEKLKPDSLAPIPLFDDDDEDSDSTHPNISKRRSKIMVLSENNTSKGKKYNVNKERFIRLRKLAQYECILLDLAAQQYVDAYYNAFVLSKKDGDSQQLNELRCKALYGICKYKNKGELGQVAPTSEDVYGNVQAVYYFFEELTKKECNLFVIRHLWDTFEKYKSPFIGRLLDDALEELADKHNYEYDDLLASLNKITEITNALEKKNTAPGNDTAAAKEEKTDDDEDEDDDEDDSKYEKLRAKKEEAVKNSLSGKSTAELENDWSDYFISRMYINLDRAVLQKKFTDATNNVALKKKNEEEKEELQNNKYEAAKHKEDFNVEKAVFIDPFYVAYDYRQGLQYIDAEAKNLLLKDQIASSATKAALEASTLMTKQMESSQTMDYNTMSLMNSWVQEYLAHADAKVQMIPIMTEYTANLESEYGTSTFVYTGVISIVEQREVGMLWAYTCVFPILLPITIALSVTPKSTNEIYFMAFDVTKGDLFYSSDNSQKGKVTPAKITTDLIKNMKKLDIQ